MALMCPSCGAENRDKARFCRGCARPLERPGDEQASTGDEDSARARRRARRRRAAASKATRPAWSRWSGVIVAAVIAMGVGWWLGTRQTSPTPAQAAPLPVATVPAAAPATVSPATTPPATDPAPADAPAQVVPAADPGTAALAVDRLRQSVEMLESQDRVRAAAQEQQRAKLAQDKQRADEARRRTDALAAAAGANNPTAAAPAAVSQSAAPAPAAVVAAPPTVDQQCAGSGNVFSRDFCRMRECGKAAFAADPVCVRFRQMEEARREEAERR